MFQEYVFRGNLCKEELITAPGPSPYHNYRVWFNSGEYSRPNLEEDTTPIVFIDLFYRMLDPYKIVFISLKGLAQAKIIKKSVILFRVLNMTI